MGVKGTEDDVRGVGVGTGVGVGVGISAGVWVGGLSNGKGAAGRAVATAAGTSGCC